MRWRYYLHTPPPGPLVRTAQAKTAVHPPWWLHPPTGLITQFLLWSIWRTMLWYVNSVYGNYASSLWDNSLIILYTAIHGHSTNIILWIINMCCTCQLVDILLKAVIIAESWLLSDNMWWVVQLEHQSHPFEGVDSKQAFLVSPMLEWCFYGEIVAIVPQNQYLF